MTCESCRGDEGRGGTCAACGADLRPPGKEGGYYACNVDPRFIANRAREAAEAKAREAAEAKGGE